MPRILWTPSCIFWGEVSTLSAFASVSVPQRLSQAKLGGPFFFFFPQKPLSASSLSQSRLSLDRHSTLKEAERKKADFQKKLLLQSNASVEKVGHVQAGAGL